VGKIIFTNGCFDILHRGHLELFRFAKGLGDRLIVGIDSDGKVVRDKGPSRPINSINERKFMLESIRWIDEVYVFQDTRGLETLVRNISPDILVIGSDWKGKKIIGRDYAKEVKYFDRVEGYSTTKIVESFINRRLLY